ncbi:YaiO family outer membrane beta-barrel protein [Fodinibius sediminis]|uniref:YaiO family outer membrane beta-barrel protein n=1 Tax=Fodinibius sediminis TaxID=1214077 RepID=UPI00163D50E2|nr:YaiO family outer membrane beta-barrel protein [Fodinibius sediminis]
MLLLLVTATSPLSTHAQQSTTNTGQRFREARHAAFEENNYHKAKQLAYQALKQSPDYHGIRIFIANLHAWEKHYQKARKELHYILIKDPDNKRALTSIIDIEQWAARPETALRWTDQALKYYPENTEFMLTEASLLSELERYNEAEQLYREILARDSNLEARRQLQRVQLKQLKYRATLSYKHERFQQHFDPWNFMEFRLSRETGVGPVIGRLQYGNRFALDGVQFNLDAYPSLYKGMYAYLNAGYSDAAIFPRYRLGLSLYQTLQGSFVLEGGIRHLDFSNSQSSVFILSLSKYWKNYLFTTRGYMVPSDSDNQQSLGILARRYFGGERFYMSLKGGMGSAGTDIEFADDFRTRNFWSIGMNGQYPLNRHFDLGGEIGFESEQFTNYNREKYSFNIFVSYRF